MNKLQDYNIILASQSPRRLEILKKHGITPAVMPVDVDETIDESVPLTDAVMMLSKRKADACLSLLNENKEIRSKIFESFPTAHPFLIMAADTIVYKDELLGKPADRKDAFRMLSAIRNTVHYVATGVTLIEIKYSTAADAETVKENLQPESAELSPAQTDYSISTQKNLTFCDVTEVHCLDYSDEEIYDYIDRESPYDKAGAYAIQGSFKEHIDYINGDLENVIGLPYNKIINSLH